MSDNTIILRINSLREEAKKLELGVVGIQSFQQRAEEDLEKAIAAAEALGMDIKHPKKALAAIEAEAESIESDLMTAFSILKQARRLINGGD